jgi:hypothetical protein
MFEDRGISNSSLNLCSKGFLFVMLTCILFFSVPLLCSGVALASSIGNGSNSGDMMVVMVVLVVVAAVLSDLDYRSHMSNCLLV